MPWLTDPTNTSNALKVRLMIADRNLSSDLRCHEMMIFKSIFPINWVPQIIFLFQYTNVASYMTRTSLINLIKSLEQIELHCIFLAFFGFGLLVFCLDLFVFFLQFVKFSIYISFFFSFLLLTFLFLPTSQHLLCQVSRAVFILSKD